MTNSLYTTPRTAARHRRRPLKILASLALAVLAIPAALAGPTLAEGPATDARSARYEVQFLTEMINHHHMAIMMTETCLEKDVEQELLDLCQSIMTSQSQEIALMQSMLSDWYGIDHEPQMGPHDGHSMADLAALDGDEFEIAFMKMMAGHHLGAVEEAQRCLRMAEHDELLDLCNTIRTSQIEEIALMRSWLCDWHDICRDRDLGFDS